MLQFGAGTQSRNLKARTKAKTTEERCLLVCSQTHVWLIPYTTQAYLSRDGTAHHALGLRTSIINLKKYPIDPATGQSNGSSSPVEVPSSQTKSKQHRQ